MTIVESRSTAEHPPAGHGAPLAGARTGGRDPVP